MPVTVVEYTGPTDRHLDYGDHLRVLSLVSGVTPQPDGSILIGRWLEVWDGQGTLRVPAGMTRPYAGKCWCDVCG